MNWIFCCGDSSHKAKETKTTVDLSKPIMPEVKLKEGQIEEGELEGLSGNQSAQSKLLNDIIAKKGDKDKKANKGYRGQPIFTTESDSDGTPFHANFGAKEKHEKDFGDVH
jgi:hypothetical protein